jgi:hypothetical protein
VTLKRFYVLDQHTMNDDSTIETSTPYCIFVDAADAEERIRTLEAQCKEWERRTWEALDKLHTAIDHKIGARCEHGVWIADHCWECGKKRPAAETSPAPTYIRNPCICVERLALQANPDCPIHGMNR